MTVSAVVITKDGQLPTLVLGSLSFCQEIILVVGSKTNKQTYQSKKVRTIHHPLNFDYAAQRNFCLKHVKTDWALFVDDDEYIGKELLREITNLGPDKHTTGYYIHRVDLVFGQSLRFGETGSAKIIRLVRKDSGHFVRPVHEHWQTHTGRIGELASPLYHLKDRFVSDFISKMSHYGHVDASVLNDEGKPYSWVRLLFYPLAKFIHNYLLQLGILDGLAGLFHAYLMSTQSLSVRIFQWENINRS